MNGWADCYRKAFFIEPFHENLFPTLNIYGLHRREKATFKCWQLKILNMKTAQLFYSLNI